jgi:hypothetical protein
MAVNEGSFETVMTNRSFQFGGSGQGVCRGQCGKSPKTSRMVPQGIGEVIIRFAGEGRRFSGFQLLYTWGSKRQYLHVDVSRIHFRNPLVAKVADLLKKLGGGPAELQSLFFEF